MQKRIFKIRKDLIITFLEKKKGKTEYITLNPLTGNSNCFDQKTFLILRHFNSRNILEVKKHLEERHGLNLSLKALESYLDLFLDLYLFENCLDLYWQRLREEEKELLKEEVNNWIREVEETSGNEVSLVESLLVQQLILDLRKGKIENVLTILEDLRKINQKHPLVNLVYNHLEESIVKIKKRNLSLTPSKWMVVVGIVFFLLIITETLLLRFDKITNQIVYTTSEILVRGKTLAL